MSQSNILTDHTLEWVNNKGLISNCMLECLHNRGLKCLSKIQFLGFPHLLSKQNVFLHARTGSGKTLAFLIPAIERLKAMEFKDKFGAGVLIISPTRELAQQTAKVLLPLCKAIGLSSLVLIGGTNNAHKIKITNSSVIVGTPGYIAEILKRKDDKKLLIKNLRILILDEADRLLDGGSHMKHIKEIIECIKLDKIQKVLVSATLNDRCLQRAESLLETKFSVISSESSKSTPCMRQINQSYINIESKDRLAMLITILKTLKTKKVLVFFNSCHSVKFHHSLLSLFDLPVLYCMGQEKQSRRMNMYNQFSIAKHGILLTTGMAERGWDIPNVSWIIQYDPPHRPEDYVHRVGRTGRGEGTLGQALLFLLPHEEKFVSYLKKFAVQLDLIEFQGNLCDINIKIKHFISTDVNLEQQAKLSFKKFVRAYQCHKLRNIFNIDQIELKELCEAFGFTKPPLELGKLT